MQRGLGNKSGENLAKARKIEKENEVNFTKKKSRELLLSFCRVFPVFQLLNKYLQFHAILANFWVNIPTVEFFANRVNSSLFWCPAKSTCQVLC